MTLILSWDQCPSQRCAAREYQAQQAAARITRNSPPRISKPLPAMSGLKVARMPPARARTMAGHNARSIGMRKQIQPTRPPITVPIEPMIAAVLGSA